MSLSHWFFAALVTAAVSALGCASETDPAPGAGADEGVESEEEIQSSAYGKFVGTWYSDTSAIASITFTRRPDHNGHHFYAEVGTGIRCAGQRCPQASRRLEGWYTVGVKTFTLSSDSPDTTYDVLGRYTYAVPIESTRALAVTHANRPMMLSLVGDD